MENRINVHNQYNNINNEFNNNPEEINNSDFNSKIFHYKEFLLNLEKEFSNNNDKLKKISSLKDQINEISDDIKTLNSLEEQAGINNKNNYSPQKKSINNLSLIVDTLEKNYLKKQKINDKIISKMSRKIKDILIYNKEITNMKKEIEEDKKQKTKIEKNINDINRIMPSIRTELNLNKHKYSELLEAHQKEKKKNLKLNEKMYNDIIQYGNEIKMLEERKEKLNKFKEEQIANLDKKEKIKDMEKVIKELKIKKDEADNENNEYKKLINDFVTHINLNYINLINLKEQIPQMNQNENKIQNYLSNKKSQCQTIEQQIENIMTKYY
jgi:DNA repair exonuclease SbcCD ATPase subunit